MDNNKIPPILTIKQACEILNCHPNTLRNWDKEGKLKSVRFGKRQDRRFKKEDILKLLKNADATNAAEPVSSEEIQLPVFGLVSCGTPKFYADENNVEDYINVDKNLLKGSLENFFLVRSTGTSMERAGIEDNSLILVEKKDHYENREDVLAIIDNMATIKRVFAGKSAMLFMPVSYEDKHEPIIVKDNYHIAGKVVSVIPDPLNINELRYINVND